MLARIAHELFWLGRDLTRGEHTARTLDGAFHADIAGAPGERSISLSWDAVLTIIGGKPPIPGEDAREVAARPAATPLGRDETARLLTLDTDSQASIVSCVARARERGRILRDVISTEMWEALNSFYLALARYDLAAAMQTGPYSVYQEVKERCALFWGLVDRTMLRDDGRAFLEAGGRIEQADMVLRMLLATVPARVRSRRTRERGDRAAAVGRRGAGVSARGARCSHGGPSGPVPALRRRVSRICRLVGGGAARRAVGRRRAAALLPAGPAPRTADRRPRAPAPNAPRQAGFRRNSRTGTGRARADRPRHRGPLLRDRSTRRACTCSARHDLSR